MPRTSRRPLFRRVALSLIVLGLGAGSSLFAGAAPAAAADYATISGSGSSWAANAIYNWTANGKKFGWTVNYDAKGSTRGRTDFLTNQVDFAVSDIPFQPKPTDGSAPEDPKAGSYAYMPIVAGGTAFMYNLKIGGRQVTNLRLSGENIARIFTGQVSAWNDAKIAADNPGLRLPATKVVPVVRADGSGSSAQFSLWMQNQYPSIWKSAYSPGGETSIWPPIKGGQPKNGDDGIANYIQQGYGDGAIGYVQYSYAKNARFPVAKLLNKAGFYVEPTPQNVAVALLKAQIEEKNTDPAVYLTQKLEGVYNDTDKRTYPMSSYSYMILPLTSTPRSSPAKAATLGAFGKYLLCDGQDAMDDLGYSPLPINLVTAAFKQLSRSPGTNVGSVPIKSCKNPTFSPDGTNRLAASAPFPPACDAKGPTQCSTGTGGAQAPTQVTPNARGTGSSSGATAGSGGTSGGGGGGSTTTGAGGTSTAAAGGSDATAGGSTEIDPETGLAAGTAGGAQVPLAGPVSLNESATGGGWSGSQTFAVLAGLLLLAVFVLPPLLISRLGRDDERRGGGRS